MQFDFRAYQKREKQLRELEEQKIADAALAGKTDEQRKVILLLDNQYKRPAARRQRTPRPEPPEPSPYRGVSWNQKRQRWQVSVEIGDHPHFIGDFLREEELLAARAYDNAKWWLQDFFIHKPRLNFEEDFPGPMLPTVQRARSICFERGLTPRAPHFADFEQPDSDPAWARDRGE